jgi:cytochrome c556
LTLFLIAGALLATGWAVYAALASTAASCKGCHDSYQIPPAAPAKPG